MTDLPAMALCAHGRSLPISRTSARYARTFTAQALTLHRLGGRHLDDTLSVVAELVANAVTHGAGDTNGTCGRPSRNISIEIGIWSKWTLITVDDRDPKVYDPSGDIEHGRGLLIVEALSERFWWRQRSVSKTANAAILRSGMKLTDDDQKILDDLENEQ